MTVPVLVQVAGWRISICVLAMLPEGPALVEKNHYRPIGEVKRSARVDKRGYTVTVWTWRDERGKDGIAPTKTAAISTMLKANGFHEVPVEATMPDLLAGLDEGDTTP